MTNAVLKRVVRRETHSPRTVATVIVLVFVAAAAVWAGTEIVLHLLGKEPLVVAPGAAIAWMAAAPGNEAEGAVVAGAAAAAVVGAVLVWLALSPGRRPKHELGASSYSVVVDNEVIASSTAEGVRRELDLPRGAVIVGISHRGADVTVRPAPGQSIAKAHVKSVAEAELAGYRLSPRPSVRARVLRRDEGGAAS